jgi:ketosteroid isomerase-like protein
METNRAFAEEVYAALNRRDLEAFIAATSGDVEFRSLVAEAEGQTYRGHHGIRQWWGEVRAALGGLAFDLQEYTEEGDGAVTKLRVRGEHGGTGIEQTMYQGG